MTRRTVRLIGRIKAISLDIGGHAEAFDVHLQSLSRSDETRASYLEAIRQLFAYLTSDENILDISVVTRREIKAFLVSLNRHKSPATVSNRARSLKVFFAWAVEDGVLIEDPLVGYTVPPPPIKEVPVVPEEELQALLATCKRGQDIFDHRDYAILRMYMCTGARRSEVANLHVSDVDLEEGRVILMGKGRRPRVVALDPETLTALRKYLRARSLRPGGDVDELWMSKLGGVFTAWGIERMLHRRCREAGIPKINLHRFRHTFAHMAMQSGMNEGDIMRIAGWRTRSMLDRYGAAQATERALSAQGRLFTKLNF